MVCPAGFEPAITVPKTVVISISPWAHGWVVLLYHNLWYNARTMENTPLLRLKQLYENQYVSQTDLEDFLIEYNLSSPIKSQVIKEKLKHLLTFRRQKLKHFEQETGQLYHLLNHREQLNQNFIKREQTKKYQIEGNVLDPQQIAAVVACEDAELILAPAGSGKTASLLAKLDYLTNQLQIPAKDILVIAFTNKVVAELKERIGQTQIEIRTFHSLGNKIVKTRLKDHRLITERQTKKIFHEAILFFCETDAKYAKSYHDYLRAYDVSDEAASFLNLITRARNNLQANAEALETLFISVQSLQKAERVTLVELRTRLERIKNPVSRAKALDFYRLYAPVAKKYDDCLRTNSFYDFADMLNLATDFVEKMPKGTLKYQYVLVDEAQDLSTSKYFLLKAILDNCRRVKLFAVGDDWQSIYRFAGSNLRVLDDFEKIFERETYRGMIELTYRFGQPTARISNKFIQKNPHQSRKRVVPYVKRQTPILIRLNLSRIKRDVPPDYEMVEQILQELYQQYGVELFAKKVQIIARYNRDIFRLVREDTREYQRAKLVNLSEVAMELEWRIDKTPQKLKIPFCSMHKAKGITRDIIIIINANSGNHGIPATRGNDLVVEMLLTKLDAYPYAEERRLWYVAITRAKEKTFIVADAKHISPFVFEISPQLRGAGVKVCPRCHRGILLEKRRRDGKIYYGCSNYAGGCRYIKQ